MLSRLVEVVLPLPLSEPYTYFVPASMEGFDLPGHRLEVPFGGRDLVGVAIRAFEGEGLHLKPVTSLLDDTPMLNGEMLRFLRWMSDYYFSTIGEVIRQALPPGAFTLPTYHVLPTPLGRRWREGIPLSPPPLLTPAQSRHLSMILDVLKPEGLSLAALRKKAGSADLGRLRELSAAGLIRLRERQAGEGVRPKLEGWVEVADPDAPAPPVLSRRPAQRAMVEALREQGPLPRGAAARLTPHGASALAVLIKEGLVRLTRRPVERRPSLEMSGETREGAPDVLWPSQARSVERVTAAMEEGGFHPFLLFGSPGSGKTEVYLRAAAHALERGKGVLMLVPEISLTPQLFRRVRERFGERVALLHSGLSDGERHDEFRRLLQGRARIAVGARSALFAPISDLGLLVVDEEHDASYKSEERVLYHARDAAVMRARKLGVPILLGSATPSPESWFRVKTERLTMLRLDDPPRVESAPLQIRMVDISRIPPARRSWLSSELVLAIEERLKRREQTILLLNRRSYAPVAACQGCGRPVSCVHCSVPLSYHRTNGRLVCHLCGASRVFDTLCDSCRRDKVELIGVGTQRLEDELDLRFPGARIGRLDRDAIGRKGALTALLNRFGAGEIDILVGTQLVAKGHDFPNVTLVGVLMCDSLLNRPDFRASERTFALLHQAAGRAGRGEKPGEVHLQTLMPDHPVYHFVVRRDVEGFLEQELKARQGLYPPFSRLAMIRLSGEAEPDLVRQSGEMAALLREAASSPPMDLEAPGLAVLGPSPAPVYKVRDRYTRRLLLRAASAASLRRFLRHGWELGLFRAPEGVKVTLDIDPVSME